MAGDWEAAGTIGQQVGGKLPPHVITGILWHPSGEPGVQVCGKCGVAYSRATVTAEGREAYVVTHSYKNGPEYTCRWPWRPAWQRRQA